MKKITLLIILMVLPTFMIGQNLITNGDFESSLGLPWSEVTGSATIVSNITDNTSPTPITNATNSLQIAAGAYAFEQLFEVTPGVTYTISLRYIWNTGGSSAGTFSTPLIRRDLTGITTIGTGGAIVESGTTGPGAVNYDLWRTNSRDFTVPADVYKARFYYTRGAAGAKLALDDIQIKVKPSITWDGSENDGDLANTANWSTDAVPTGTDVVLIPSGLSSYPLSGNITADEIFIDHGATFITSGTVIGGMHYYAKVDDANWHLISSAGMTQVQNNNWISANGVASGSVSSNNRGISTYQNGTSDGTTGPWVYFQAGGTETYDTGKGYSMKRLAPGLYTFNGTYNQAPEDITITQGASNNWNLIANPFTSYLDIASFLSTNAAALTDASEAVYVWNAGSSSYNALTTGYIYPGQAFFVNSALASTTVTITAAMESHQSSATFYKSEGNISIKLRLSDGTYIKDSEIYYLDGKTKGLDRRFDVSLFDGVASDLKLYTNLLEGYEGTAFMKQALPNSDLESLVVPIGIKAAAGQEITFSAEAMNLPEGIKVFLEDRQNNTITRLDEANATYKVTLAEAVDGNGRFFLHTKASGVLSTDAIALQNVSIYKTSNETLRVVGLTQGTANMKVFNVLGKQVLNTTFQSKGANDITLPKLATGMYIVQLQSDNGKMNKKIILE
jgi:hypothetical protein